MDVMQLRRNLLMQKVDSGRLPAEYQQVEWVNGNGCDIDLNYIPTVKPKVITSMALTSTSDRDAMGFSANRSPSFIIDIYYQGGALKTNWYNRYGSTSSYDFTYQLDYTPSNSGSIHSDLFEFGSVVKVNNVQYVTLTDVDWSNNTQSFHLFAGRSKSDGIRFYTFELWDGAELVRNLIPCYRKADDVIGLYDTVTSTFFTSATGTLTKGNNV